MWRDPRARALALLVLAMLAVRFATLGAYPFMDTTEARYGEIARVMLQTGNFVTPQEVPGTPFWAKPPLYAWLSAASMAVFGVGEFAARLPSWLCALAVLALCMPWAAALVTPAQPQARARAAAWAGALLVAAPLFFVSAGAVMTDPCLALCITALVACFDHCVVRGQAGAAWRWGFFVAAGLGMLAKGPVIGLYAGVPLLAWVAWRGRWRQAWQALPWLRGSLLAIAICLPWYVWAEVRTPGFLRYFLLGEHIMRFIQPGWGGDLYGTAHAEPRGMIWLYQAGALGLLAPLALALAAAAPRRPAQAGAPAAAGESLRLLMLVAVVPLAFFSVAGNIIWTYVLPELGPLAVLLAALLAPRVQASAAWRRAALAAVFGSAVLVAGATLFWVPRHTAAHSARDLVAAWRAQGGTGSIVFVGRKIPASLRFYTGGEAVAVAHAAAALDLPPGGSRTIALTPAAAEELGDAAAQLPGTYVIVTVARNTDLVLVVVRRTAP